MSVEGRPEVPEIVKATTRQVEIINRMDIVAARYTRLVEKVTYPVMSYTPSHATGGSQININLEDAKKGFSRVMTGLKLDLIDSGMVGDDEYNKLLKGELGEAPKVEEAGVDSDGHMMLRRGNPKKGSGHWFCPLDNTFRWDKEV